MIIDLEKKQTVIIPVTKIKEGEDIKYRIEINENLFNEFQVLVLKGATKEDLIAYFEVKE